MNRGELAEKAQWEIWLCLCVLCEAAVEHNTPQAMEQ